MRMRMRTLKRLGRISIELLSGGTVEAGMRSRRMTGLERVLIESLSGGGDIEEVDWICARDETDDLGEWGDWSYCGGPSDWEIAI